MVKGARCPAPFTGTCPYAFASFQAPGVVGVIIGTNGSQSPSKMGQFLKRAPAAYEVGQCKSDTTLQIARVSVQDNEASQRYLLRLV
ncbi:hypothetical protein WN944_024531 [Citrus x changshan-huyou]|uniref:Uncharacterized protein n=1 Tax=Citrus x changshan-huyou TaxID=2935761 RepID=A0AAP0LP32_9ROSI